jgi:hypothetical protein
LQKTIQDLKKRIREACAKIIKKVSITNRRMLNIV